ncbi:hypothetical protein KR222_009118 [Zaprionus bogoriensis]|nr:hypothetical protein KR222_009118 [Zaprionus bogoriensis]
MNPYDDYEDNLDRQSQLNYFPESNPRRATPQTRAGKRRGQRSSDAGSTGHPRRKHTAKQKSPQMKLKDDDEVTIIASQKKSPQVHTFFQSPRRNGLSPRVDLIDEDDEEEEGKMLRSMGGGMQDDYKQHQHHQHTNRRSQLSIKHAHRPSYSCSSCGATFHIKSLLGAHRRTHDDDFKVRFRSRRARDSTTAMAAATASSGKQCKFCDRFFDLERALRIHQLCHCNKITPQQRRKLGYTDLAHEKKNAPLPTFERIPKSQMVLNTVPDPNMPYVALGPGAIKMIEQEQQQKAKRRPTKYTVKVAGPMGRWR